MTKSLIVAALVLMALGAVAAPMMTGAVAPAEPQMNAETFSPFESMQNMHGLPVQITDNAF